MNCYNDTTMFQQAFLSLMGAEDINYMNKIDGKLTAIAESMGVKFKHK